jgi:hypothetical protein
LRRTLLTAAIALLHEGDYFERLTVYCAGCETAHVQRLQAQRSGRNQDEGLAGVDFLMMSTIEAEDGGAMRTHHGRCPGATARTRSTSGAQLEARTVGRCRTVFWWRPRRTARPTSGGILIRRSQLSTVLIPHSSSPAM